MADIFISYARADRDKVEKLASILESKGYSVWWDRQIVGGREFTEEIERELNNAGAVVVSWSEHAVKSPWVRDEASAARDQLKLAPIRLDQSSPPMGFRQFHAIEFTQWSCKAGTDAIEDLDRTIQSILNCAPSQQMPPQVMQEPQKPEGLSDWFKTSRILWFAILVFVALSAGIYTFYRGWQTPEASASQNDINIIAVMPFENRSSGNTGDQFATGFHSDIIMNLTQYSELEVIASRSIVEIVDQTLTLSEIGDLLGANVILDGEIDRTPQRIRLSLQLIDITNNKQIWSRSFDRSLSADNIFALEDEIASAVAGALGAKVNDLRARQHQSSQTSDIEAYDAFAHGQLLAIYPGDDPETNYHAAVEAFEKAIDLDPEYAAAYAGLAGVHLSRYRALAAASAERGQTLIAAKLALDKALFLAPDSAEAKFAEAFYYLWGVIDFEKADVAYDRVIELAPSHSSALFGKGLVARKLGNFEESFAIIEKAVRLNPLDYSGLADFSRTLALYGRFNEAWSAHERARMLSKDNVSNAISEAYLWEAQGEAEKAYLAFKNDSEKVGIRYYYWRTYHALNTRNPIYINEALDAWPEHLRNGGPFPETYTILSLRGAEISREGIRTERLIQRLRNRPINRSDVGQRNWPPFAPYFPVTIPALLGDHARVKSEIRSFEGGVENDQWNSLLVHRPAMLDALALVGDRDGAFALIEQTINVLGPAAYLKLSIDAELQLLRDDPRWGSIEEEYKQWAKDSAYNE